MTHLCCTSCRLRFAPSVDELAPCPLCGAAKISLDAESAVGFRRDHTEIPQTLAAAVALRLPDGRGT